MSKLINLEDGNSGGSQLLLVGIILVIILRVMGAAIVASSLRWYPMLQVKTRLVEVKELAQGHTAGRVQAARDLKPHL